MFNLKKIKFENNFTDSDIVTFAIGIVLLSLGFLVIFDPFKIDESLLLCFGIFALLIGIASPIKRKSLRQLLIFFSILVSATTFWFLGKYTFDLSNSNNGVSFLAIGYSVFMLPFSRTNKEKEQAELNRLNEIIQNHKSEMDTRLETAKTDSEKQLNEITLQKNTRIEELIKEKEDRAKELTQEKDERIREIIKEKDAQINQIEETKNTRIETLNEYLKEKDAQIDKIKEDEDLRIKALTKDFKDLKVQERNKTLTLIKQHSEETDLLKKNLELLEKRIHDLKLENRKLQSEKIKIQTKKLRDDSLKISSNKNNALSRSYLENLPSNNHLPSTNHLPLSKIFDKYGLSNSGNVLNNSSLSSSAKDSILGPVNPPHLASINNLVKNTNLLGSVIPPHLKDL